MAHSKVDNNFPYSVGWSYIGNNVYAYCDDNHKLRLVVGLDQNGWYWRKAWTFNKQSGFVSADAAKMAARMGVENG